MKKNKASRIYYIDNEEMVFDFDSFNTLFCRKARSSELGLLNYECVLGDEIGLSESTVHSWRNLQNGPGDLDVIQHIADFWHIELSQLLKRKDAEQTVEADQLTDRQLEALRRVNIAFMAYVDGYLCSEGFLWDKSGNEYDITTAEHLYSNLLTTLDEEYVDLRGPLYDELYSFFISAIVYELFACASPLEEGEPDEHIDIYGHVLGLFREIINQYK